MSTNELRVNVRYARYKPDMPRILEIENKSYEFPWSKKNFSDCWHRSHIKCMVAEYAGRIIGFMIYELQKTSIHLLNFVVAPEFRRQMVGSQMVAKLMAKLSPNRRWQIILAVRETNLATQLFFRESGFKAIETLYNYYEHTPENAYVMQYCLADCPSKIPAHYKQEFCPVANNNTSGFEATEWNPEDLSKEDPWHLW